jgi:hypothetical protein
VNESADGESLNKFAGENIRKRQPMCHLLMAKATLNRKSLEREKILQKYYIAKKDHKIILKL